MPDVETTDCENVDDADFSCEECGETVIGNYRYCPECDLKISRCPECNGTGKSYDRLALCPLCKGSGRMDD